MINHEKNKTWRRQAKRSNFRSWQWEKMAILTKKRMGKIQGGAIVIGTIVIITIVLAGMFS